jgi:cellulose synthase/poly-beta-1,6-N-acetylglucosamine synthase-like glycosyltransferase
MTAREPIVSVVIPAYNAAAFIGETLASVLGQTLGDLEVLVIDDGSQDETSAIVEHVANEDPRVRLVHQENEGVGCARNMGIRLARGAYIAPIDADDVWRLDKLEKQVTRMEECGDETGMVYCWSDLIDRMGRRVGESRAYRAEGYVARALIVRNILANASVPLFRAKALSDVGGYLTRDQQRGAQGCEDWDLALRVAERYEVHVVPEALVAYREVPLGLSFRTDAMRCSYEIMCDRLRARNPGLPGSLLRWSAGRFHQYLASRAYGQGDHASAVRHTLRAMVSDPVAALNTRSQIRLARSVMQLARGRPAAHRAAATVAAPDTCDPSLPPAMPRRPRIGNALYERIESRRWSAVLTAQASAPAHGATNR